MRIAAVMADEGGCGHYRMALPYTELRRRGHRVDLGVIYEFHTPTGTPEYPSDVIVVQRPGNVDHLQVLDVGRAAGVPVVAEIDDLIWSIPTWNPTWAKWNGKPEAAAKVRLNGEPAKLEFGAAGEKRTNNVVILRRFLARCDAITASTEPLAAECRAAWPRTPVYVLPNCVRVSEWPPADRGIAWATSGRVTVGWGGSWTHKEDLETIAGIPAQAVADLPWVRLLMFGGYAEAPRLLGRGFPPERMEEVGWHHDPGSVWSVVREIDVGLAPVLPHRFNACKSDLKALEFAASGTPTVATDYVTYRGFVRDGETGFLCKRPGDWARAIRRLCQDHALRAEMGRKARAEAVKRDIRANAHLWETALAEIVERRARRPAAAAGR